MCGVVGCKYRRLDLGLKDRNTRLTPFRQAPGARAAKAPTLIFQFSSSSAGKLSQGRLEIPDYSNSHLIGKV
jgi:hypothetical protein